MGTSQAQPVERIAILAPGENSLVTTPIEITAVVFPGDDGLIRVTLVDKHQNLLTRQLLRVESPSDTAIEFTTSLVFEIPAETSTANLTIATQDHLHRPLALRSIGLDLASSGEAQIQAQLANDPWLTVTHPEPGAMIGESPMLITGTVRPINENPIVFELLNERGGAIVSKQLAVGAPSENLDFEFFLAYPPAANMRDMRLVIRQSAGWLGVEAILDSLPVTIIP